MCFHNSISAKAQKLAARYGLKIDVVEIYKEIMEEYHVNVFSNPYYPVITNDPQIQVMKWGLIPFWEKTEADAEQIRKMTYNAKAETVFEKPSFRESVKSHRCIVPSTGYFEWHHNADKTKTPYFIFLKDEEIFSMAVIYDIWQNKETGEVLHTFSIITTEANPLTAQIHNAKKRMPAILSKEDELKWIDPKLTKEDITDLLKPFDASRMDAYQINNDFIKKI
ncbi:putative SOS response-associated peptidase YedK [Dysgonomonas hofstadii]|uniref:Abasic site processing protein n=1 Tax=Dysgonomonas hofstadii TaxID=637886 RepID=A0A840CKP4_9BACT|nr:SOS response-associated peptidase [Dysgonomonas hofstadii]MBB4036550.1 putative SOS response-associated peptidase YedK [Dysgonomonas hofstadii]